MAGLKTYRQKRDFAQTREPRGRAARGRSRRYVIQKHDATRLHYDLRLELDGVMMSWAVTRGPSLVRGEKRLAIHVEDHPVEYNSFEGTIPKGQYGGGTVMIWDRGTWTPEGDPHKGMAKGHLDFEIEGEKLHGRWHLVRMRKRPGEKQEPWLLIKSDDAFARGARDEDVLEEQPDSVVSGRSIADIAGAKGRVWNSDRSRGEARKKPAAAKPATARTTKAPKAKRVSRAKAARKTKAGKKKTKDRAAALAAIAGARPRAQPRFIAPYLALLNERPPETGDYVHEIKFDGYRMQARIADGRARLFTRNGLDWTDRFAGIAQALEGLRVTSATIDGEIVSLDDRGISDFSALQADLKSGRHDRMRYYVFDLLHLDGIDLTGAALVDRKALLEDVMKAARDPALEYSEHFVTSGTHLLEQACRMQLEGIISKRSAAPYRSGRGGDWIKTKCTANQEFVIAGYEPSTTASRTVRSLLLGYYAGKDFRYAGRVGTGFSVATERALMQALRKAASTAMPFAQLPDEERGRKVTWVKPALVAEIDFRGWTHGGVLRQAAFKGLREDKPARDVVRETKMPSTTKATAKKPARVTAKPKASKNVVSVAGVTLSHPDRVYWDDAGVTKQMLAEYYVAIWDWIAPHLVNRPLALVRCPAGAKLAKCFFQKHASAGLESERLKLIPQKGEEALIAVDDLSGLIALAQAGTLELHIWGTDADHLDTCNRLIFDLDPGPGLSFADVKQGAQDVRKRLEKLGLETFVKTTGGKGLHVVVPIAPAPWDAAKDFAHAFALAMEKDDAARYVSVATKSKRDGRIFVDYLRNARGATAIAPYSTRARPGATVAVPIAWSELGGLKAANIYSVLSLPKRLAKLKRDPWAGIAKRRQKLPGL